LTITGLPIGAILTIFDNEVVNIGNNDTVLYTTTTVNTLPIVWTHAGVTNQVRIEVIATGFVEVMLDYTLSTSDQTLNIPMVIDIN